MPASTASRTVAIASSRLVGPQTCPMPPPPRVRQLISPSFPNGLCSMAIILRFKKSERLLAFGRVRRIRTEPTFLMVWPRDSAFCKMTSMTKMTMKGSAGDRATWAVAEAKSRFSEMMDRALADGPQIITRKGQEAVVVVSAEEWRRKSRRAGNLAEFFATSPLRGSGLKIKRTKDGPRAIEL